MGDKPIFFIGFLLLALSVLIDVYIFRLQIREMKVKTALQPLKWFLLGSVIFLMIASLSFMTIYADIIWTFTKSIVLVNTGIIANALSKILIGVMLVSIYKYRNNEVK